MNWNCEQTEARLSEYLDRLLPAAEHDALDVHAKQCARCAGLVRTVRGTLARVHQLDMLEAPPQLAYNILDATLGRRSSQGGAWRSWLRPLEMVWQPRFALGVATVALTLALVLPLTGFQAGSFTLSDLHPVSLYRTADRKINLAYARSVKFINDLRVVYEIQSRLGGSSRPAGPAEGEQTPPQPKPGDPQRQRNRADETNPHPIIIASAWSGLTERSNR